LAWRGPVYEMRMEGQHIKMISKNKTIISI
jgi:hypothetical protein